MPGYNEIADIDVINGNMDKIDVQMKKNADSAQQSKDIVSDEYSATNTYAVGDYCIHENVLYKCKTAITTGEAFDSNKWVQTTCGTEFGELNSNLDGLENDCLTLQNTPLKNGVYLGNTGDFSAFNDYKCSEFHEITPNTPIKLELNTDNDDWGLLFYDENKTYLGISNSVLVISGKSIETTTPPNAKYATFNIHLYNGNFPIPKLYTTKIGRVVSNVNESMVDQKMLGWSVPKECPVQNYVDSDGVFHQIVGRVDLGTLGWTYDVPNTQFYTDIILQIKQDEIWIYDIYCSKYITASYGDKRIALNGGRIYIGDSSYTGLSS